MFTGIIEEVGRVRERTAGGLVITAQRTLEGMKLGDSMAVNGVCLTITRLEPDAFAVDVVPETFRRSNLGALNPGDPVNLERPLSPTDRLGGHIVQGHVEGVGQVLAMTPEGNAVNMRFAVSRRLLRYIVAKGFIALDGISLTVVDADDQGFSVTVIPFTREHTNLGARRVGDPVNLETDIIARYVERLQQLPPEP
ncbi:MAG: riboflavin synthase [Chloroflexi bacterium]|nr:riboflavin synthase [Chloroflexota bacterium]